MGSLMDKRSRGGRNLPVVLVTAVGAPPGLNALRALKEKRHYKLIAADADPMSPGLYLYGDGTVLPKAANEKEYIAALTALISARQISVIIPCVEEEILVLAKYRKQFEKLGVRMLIPEYPVVNAATNKEKLLDFAMRNGIACPRTRGIPAKMGIRERKRELADFTDASSPPWIVKPCMGHGMHDVFQVDSLGEAWDCIKSAKRDFVVQEFIPGKVGSMYLVGLLYNFKGELVRRFVSRSIRTLYPTGGPATAGISLDLPVLAEVTERLIGLVGEWCGPVNVEWMLDPRDEEFKLIEINPRMWGYGYLAVGSGTNFPDLIVKLACGKDVGKDPGYRTGVVMLRATHDVIVQDASSIGS